MDFQLFLVDSLKVAVGTSDFVLLFHVKDCDVIAISTLACEPLSTVVAQEVSEVTFIRCHTRFLFNHQVVMQLTVAVKIKLIVRSLATEIA